jgi:hypothetical protein
VVRTNQPPTVVSGDNVALELVEGTAGKIGQADAGLLFAGAVHGAVRQCPR